jgi:hypothetical protein
VSATLDVYLLASSTTPEPITNRVLTQIEAGEEIVEPALKLEIRRSKQEARARQRRSSAQTESWRRRSDEYRQEQDRHRAKEDRAEQEVLRFLLGNLDDGRVEKLAGCLEKTIWSDLGRRLVGGSAS